MSMIKPAFPVLKTTATLATYLVWAALMTDDGENNVRNGGTDDLTFRDLIDPNSPVYRFFEPFDPSEGLVASPERRDSGVKCLNNTHAKLATRLGGVSFELPGATGSTTTDHWMLVMRVRSTGNGAFIHKGIDSTNNDLYIYTISNNSLIIKVGSDTLSINTSVSPYTDGAPFLSGSQDMTIVVASAGSGRFKATWTGHSQERLGPAGPADGELQDPSGKFFNVRFGARGTTNDADSDSIGWLHPNLNIYSAQVFKRATVFTEAEMLSMANDTYQCFREANHPLSTRDQAIQALEFNKAVTYAGDSQSIEHPHRLPHGIKTNHVPVGNATSMFHSSYVASSNVGASSTHTGATGVAWAETAAAITDAGLPASLAGLLCNRFSLANFSGNVADTTEIYRLLLWNVAAMFLGETIWTQGIDLEAVLLYASSPAMTSPGNMQLRTQRGTTSDSTFTPDYSTAGLKSHRLAVPANAASSQTFARLRTAAGINETNGSIVVVGAYFEIPDGEGGREPGYGWDTIAEAGFSSADWLAASSAQAFADKWANTVIPEQVNIMLGHNQETGQTTQLDAGNLTGDYTDDITDFCDMVLEGLSAARHQNLDFTTRTSIILTTPWAAPASASPMDDPTNALTIEAVHAALAEERNFIHASLLRRFNYTNPLAGGLHPGDGGADGNAEAKMVADAWVAELNSYLAKTGGGTPPINPLLAKFNPRDSRHPLDQIMDEGDNFGALL